MVSVLKKISLSGDISLTKGYFVTKLLVFIIYQGISFGGFALKIEFVVFVYELIIYLRKKLFILLFGYVITSLQTTYTVTK